MCLCSHMSATSSTTRERSRERRSSTGIFRDRKQRRPGFRIGKLGEFHTPIVLREKKSNEEVFFVINGTNLRVVDDVLKQVGQKYFAKRGSIEYIDLEPELKLDSNDPRSDLDLLKILKYLKDAVSNNSIIDVQFLVYITTLQESRLEEPFLQTIMDVVITQCYWDLLRFLVDPDRIISPNRTSLLGYLQMIGPIGYQPLIYENLFDANIEKIVAVDCYFNASVTMRAIRGYTETDVLSDNKARERFIAALESAASNGWVKNVRMLVGRAGLARGTSLNGYIDQFNAIYEKTPPTKKAAVALVFDVYFSVGDEKAW